MTTFLASLIVVPIFILGFMFSVGCCCGTKCWTCADESTDHQIAVTLAGIADGTCTDCDLYDGTYVCDFDSRSGDFGNSDECTFENPCRCVFLGLATITPGLTCGASTFFADVYLRVYFSHYPDSTYPSDGTPASIAYCAPTDPSLGRHYEVLVLKEREVASIYDFWGAAWILRATGDPFACDDVDALSLTYSCPGGGGIAASPACDFSPATCTIDLL